MSAAPAAALLAALAVAALLVSQAWVVALICAVLLVAALRAPANRRWPYLIGALTSAASVMLLTPFVEVIGSHPLWTGPTIPVLGTIDVTREEIANGIFQGLRLGAVALAFAVYALLIDHDRLLGSAGWARRSTVAVALATRLVPLLERDARDLREALRGRGVNSAPARLLSPLLAGSLERGLNVAEAMEARGYGRPGRTRAPQPAWAWLDHGGAPARGRDRVGGRAGSSDRRRPALLLRQRPAGAATASRCESSRASGSCCSAPRRAGKSTLLRALAGLVPHFHGGTFAGSVVVGGLDTRRSHPAQLAGTVASVFQDPEDQVVMSRVGNEVAFGLENLGVEPAEIWPRVDEALGARRRASTSPTHRR